VHCNRKTRERAKHCNRQSENPFDFSSLCGPPQQKVRNPGTDGAAQIKQQCRDAYKHNPTDAIQCHYCYKQSEKKSLLPYFDEAQYNKEEFITRDILKLSKSIKEKLPRTDNSINNSIMV